MVTARSNDPHRVDGEPEGGEYELLRPKAPIARSEADLAAMTALVRRG